MIVERLRFVRIKSSNIQFLISILIGWILCGKLWQINDLSANESYGIEHSLCPPCRNAVCPWCDPEMSHMTRDARNTNVQSGFFRKYSYRPQNLNEDILCRWRLDTEKNVYETINQEPKVGINGMWNLELKQVEKFALEHTKNEKTSFIGLLRRTDPFYGTVYHVKLSTKDGNSRNGLNLLQLNRGYHGSKPKLLSLDFLGKPEMITIISPVMKVSDRFHLFLNRFEQRILKNSYDGSGNVKLLFVIFASEEDENDKATKEVLNVVRDFKKRNPKAIVEYTLTRGKFSRALGLHIGVQKCKPDDLMLFIDVDLNISNEFLNRMRRNAKQHERVVFPVTFSQYDPKIINQAVEIGAIPREIAANKLEINEQTGFWIHYAFGITAMYKSDYEKVGGFKLDISGWGGEDVDLYKKFIADPQIEVFAAVDPDLIHVYHSRGCDKNLSKEQYVMCVGAWSETLGSEIEVASLYLKATEIL